MNRFFCAALFTMFVLCIAVRADQTIIGSLTIVSNTTANSSAFESNSVSARIGSIFISNGGTSNTNALSGTIQVSTDNTNFISVGSTYKPSSTNAGTDRILPQAFSIPLYFRLSTTTTNSVQLGAIYID